MSSGIGMSESDETSVTVGILARCFSFHFTEALMGKLSMSCDHTLGVFVVDELNDVNDYFSIFLVSFVPP